VYHDRSAEFFPERFTMPASFTADSADGTVPPQSVWRLADTLRARGKTDLLLISRSIGHSTNYADAKALIDFVIDQAATTSVKGRMTSNPSSSLRVWHNSSGRVCFTLPTHDGDTKVLLNVYDIRGKLVRTLIIKPGTIGLWYGKNAQGLPMSNGQYVFRLMTERGPLSIKGYLVR
jgi:flagellar hook assembly protein FlgD